MFSWLFHKHLYTLIALSVIAVVLTMVATVSLQPETTYITDTVTRGTVQELVSVSGVATVERTADLAFPVTGIVSAVLVDEGDTATTGATLVTLESADLEADRIEALAAITTAIANRDELLAGPTESTRTVTANTVDQATEALATTKAVEAEKITSAYRTLLSSELTAYTEDNDEDAEAPIVTGTYTCDTEGQYQIEVYSSNSASGYSYRLSGLETGTFQVSTLQPAPLGACGLEIQFYSDSSYNRSTWYIDIPNTRAASYISNRNAYSLAVTQSQAAISNAEEALALVQATAIDDNAPARTEAITRANAAITQARARLAHIEADIADRILRAPFPGTVTAVDTVVGETVSNTPVVTLLGTSGFEITAYIPEIDIGKLALGQTVTMTFDAKSDETLTGEITFIALNSTEIDGVAYYETLITPDTSPAWLRSGLNADIDIIVSEVTNELRIPRRFLITSDTGYHVLTLVGEQVATSSVDVILDGNDGFVAISGISEGTTLVAP